MTPGRARDLLVECCLRLHTIPDRRIPSIVDDLTIQREMRRTVLESVRLCFKECGLEWDDPAAEDLVRAIEVLEGEAQGWGAPSDLVTQHFDQMREAVGRLP